MKKKSLPRPKDREPILVAHFDLECGFALVLESELEWLANCSDVVARKSKPWEMKIDRRTYGFEVVSASASVIDNVTPKEGNRRRNRNARCGGNRAAVDISCFPLSSGRFAKIELAGYSFCVAGSQVCDETYVKIGDITIAWDAACRRIAQRHPQHRWVCLP
jgi:hypothetical protein